MNVGWPEASNAYRYYQRLLEGNWMSKALCWTIVVSRDWRSMTLTETAGIMRTRW